MKEEILEKRITLLEKALMRERLARSEIEKQLENYSRESYISQQNLINAIQNEELMQEQLEFLAFLTQYILSENSLSSLRTKFTEHLAYLIGHQWMIHLVIEYGHINDKHSVYNKAGQWLKFNNTELIFASIEQLVPKDVNNWHLFTQQQLMVFNSHHPEFEAQNLLSFRYEVNNDAGIICIGLDDFVLSDEAKKTLHIAGLQFCTAIANWQNRQNSDATTFAIDDIYKELEETQRLLSQNEKLVSIGILAAGVAHEINNPLSYVMSNLELIGESLSELAIERNNKFELQELVAICHEGLKKISNIVSSISKISRQSRGNFQPLCITDVIHDARQVISHRINQGYDFVEVFTPKVPTINGHYDELEQVFVNLFTNALDAMPSGGTIRVSVSSEDGYVVVVVSDNGIGMTKEVMSSIFSPFFTSKEVDKGTGLGLSISYAIIERHHADIQVNSKPNEGSRFTIRFKEC